MGESTGGYGRDAVQRMNECHKVGESTGGYGRDAVQRMNEWHKVETALGVWMVNKGLG